MTGSTEISCPQSGELLTVPIDDLMDEEVYQYRACNGDLFAGCVWRISPDANQCPDTMRPDDRPAHEPCLRSRQL